MIRLDRYLANMGCGTRKEVRKLIASGAVAVNGAAATDHGVRIREEVDAVCVSGEQIEYRPYIYLMMNKPAGVLSATEDAGGAITAVDLVGSQYAHYDLSPAGRLDKDSEGFLILTNDGGYIHRVISPVKHVDKRYYCRLKSEISEEDIAAFADGILLGDGELCKPALLEYGPADEGAPSAFVTIHEGKFHQVKRMFLSRGNQVLYLKRLRIGEAVLDPSLPPGAYREMTAEEKNLVLNENDRLEETI